MHEQNQHLEALQDIRQMMQRSSRFISLSGLSGIAAGFWALLGAFAADVMIAGYYHQYQRQPYYSDVEFQQLKLRLFLLAAGILGLALISAFYFTWRKTKEDKVPLWNRTSRQLAINMLIPLIAGGLFILTMLQHNEWRFIAPASLIFYGVALVNGSKYTLSDIRYLGISEIILGLVATQFIGAGLYFWAVGFGILHIIYGFIMWWKNERKPVVA
jgi:heme/copper-type cytochrome/quinol oxidase subunit 3